MLLTYKKNLSGWLDVGQSVFGVILALFLWLHTMLVSSIKLGEEEMAFVAKTMKLSFLSEEGRGFPWVVSLVALGIAILTLLHAWVVIQKIPLNLAQQRVLKKQMTVIKHTDTRLWFWQVVTGIGLFILLPIHLWLIGSAPQIIGPEGSANRVWNEAGWIMYVPLLLCAQLHAAIGIYRVAMKWGVKRAVNNRAHVKKIMITFGIVFSGLGMASLFAFMPYAG